MQSAWIVILSVIQMTEIAVEYTTAKSKMVVTVTPYRRHL